MFELVTIFFGAVIQKSFHKPLRVYCLDGVSVVYETGMIERCIH